MSRVHRSIETFDDSMVFVRGCSHASNALNAHMRKSKAKKSRPRAASTCCGETGCR
jgi:hypothetical protein